ncbi:MAG: hypothetical protein ACPGLV_13205, partial [Bacteroidia bacterium]
MKVLHTNRALAELYTQKINELGWELTNKTEKANIISLRTSGMFKALRQIQHPNTVWGIPMAFHLVGKQNLWFHIQKLYGKKRATLITPKTYIIKQKADFDELKHDLANGMSIVLKTNKQRRQGLKLVESNSELDQELTAEHVIAQTLKKETLEFDNRKFHLRFYLAISIINGSIQAYLHPKSRVVFAQKNAENNYNKYITQNEYYDNSLPLFGFDLVGKKLLSLNTLSRVKTLLKVALKPYLNLLRRHTTTNTCYYD